MRNDLPGWKYYHRKSTIVIHKGGDGGGGVGGDGGIIMEIEIIPEKYGAKKNDDMNLIEILNRMKKNDMTSLVRANIFF
ncbi:hypothetical protein DERF_004306 [Dermatophagoides farinae]|uniref:Uncharacterized protein n=1 Tax=Dermatophagoides farinae TaxID=6954 RepID=A0A922I251_DERFA|nr:hypothetical protein DERF_004306 [Dermatophagoides farinae]